MNNGNDDLSLGQLIWVVRRELEWARQVDEDHPLRFDVDTVELDVAVEAKKVTGGKLGLSAKVVGMGGEGGFSREGTRGYTTRIHLILNARDAAGAKFDIAAADTAPPPPWAAASEGPDGA